MKRLFVSALALGLSATTGLASAQTYRSASSTPYYGQGTAVRYDYARVIRVDPVFDSRYGSNYPTSNSQRCYQRQTYVNGDGYNDGGYSNGSYSNGGYSDYGRDTYGNDGYYDQYGNYHRNTGSQTGATVATVVGGILGAAIGSQVGGGSARYATSAIGSMVGGMAGRQIYEQRQRQRQPDRVGTVTVCDPVPVGSNGNGYYASNDRSVESYDVTYEYAGQQYTTRTSYHPGDRIRVRVDVRPE
ncbi:glycine zipper 2TM domain-containing protein [Lysobacter niabensis]|uniref:glycine zipper 2TM domain-containing protein n=1 Tax=Agrilutibacter niabensis TaxID=380628 RepID=UPI0036152097